MTLTAPLEVVASHIEAFNRRDAEAVVATFAEEAVFASGDVLVVGRRGLLALFREAFAVPAGVELVLRRSYVEGDTAACELVERIDVAGATHELEVAGFYTVRGGRLVRVKVYRDAA